MYECQDCKFVIIKEGYSWTEGFCPWLEEKINRMGLCRVDAENIMKTEVFKTASIENQEYLLNAMGVKESSFPIKIRVSIQERKVDELKRHIEILQEKIDKKRKIINELKKMEE